MTAAPPIARPAAGDYMAWYQPYLDAARDDVLAQLAAQPAELEALLARTDEARANAAYAPGKWTVKDVLQHLVDAERVFAYRLLRIARGDATPLPGFDEDAYAVAAHAPARPLADVRAEFAAVRAATLGLVHSLDAAALARRGTASGHAISAAALVYILAGHVAHHARVLRERYDLGA